MIDRKELVTRHNPGLSAFDRHSPLSVGNGEFVFTADITGLQSFPQFYDCKPATGPNTGEFAENAPESGRPARAAMPLCTMANWGWHSTPFSADTPHIPKEDVGTKEYDTYGRQVSYYTSRTNAPAYHWVRQNPHKYHLGRVGFVFTSDNKSELAHEAITDINQELDLYTGILHSRYNAGGTACTVKTAVCANSDTIAVQAESRLIAAGQMHVVLEFPYPTHEIGGAEWHGEERHTSTLVKASDSWKIHRIIDEVKFDVVVNGKNITVEQVGTHKFYVKTTAEKIDLTITFVGANCVRPTLEPNQEQGEHSSPLQTSAAKWQHYWENGGMISLAKSTDPRAHELERRIILSQYLTALQCGGSLPPAETGLTCNSWYGKFHLEMHYWHAAHFATFNRPQFLENSLQWYFDIMPAAKKATALQGYEGTRWPKMVDPSGQDSPSPIGPLLIWQQPHVLFYCEWMYKSTPTAATLEKYRPLVEETANFMASFAHYDGTRYNLGPPVIPAQENHPAVGGLNPTYELAYWQYGLRVAIQWYKDMKLEPPAQWLHVMQNLAAPTINDGVYVAHENCPDTFENFNKDHPSMLMAYGVVGGSDINKEAMNATLDRVLTDWNYPTMWGWDFGVMAMTATRLGRPEVAIEVLLKETEKNVYVASGHNRQVLRSDLPLYLPGNGSLLLAVAMMAAGYDGCTTKTPGFNLPGWQVEFENILPYSCEV